jgi:predicted Zn-ribbon and HTH transcriptional regulator
MEDQEHLREQIYNSLNLRETEDLIKIWQTHDSNEWTDVALEVVKNILQQRLGKIPPQYNTVDNEFDTNDESIEVDESLRCPNCKSSNVIMREVELRGQKVILKRPEVSLGRFVGVDVDSDEIVALACEDCGHVFFMLKDFIEFSN